jgi:hypothetical protein
MAISSDSRAAKEAKMPDHTPETTGSTSSKHSIDSNKTMVNSIDNTAEFVGDIGTNNTLPTVKILRKIEDYQLLDAEGKSHTFKSLYSGPGITRRVLVIFIRHFFCGVRLPSPALSHHS